MTGRIGETATQDQEATGENKKMIVADSSRIGKGKLPQTGSSNTSSLINPVHALLIFFILSLIRKIRHIFVKLDY
ncbi:hypothetical protein [Enterococcus mundtii]|uniref:hypothetical protein n=1 Tax=Enterococcus mundtii TaxID=53346 RepID=UPI0032DF2ACA